MSRNPDFRGKRHGRGIARLLVGGWLLAAAICVSSAIAANPPVYQIQVGSPPPGTSARDAFTWTGADATDAWKTHVFKFGETYNYDVSAATPGSFKLGDTTTYASGLLLGRIGSGTTFDLNGANRDFTDVLFNNWSTLRFTSGTGTYTATFTDAVVNTTGTPTGMGSVWLDGANMTWNPTTFHQQNADGTFSPIAAGSLSDAQHAGAALALTNVFGQGTITNQYQYTANGSPVNKTTVWGSISPSYWDIFVTGAGARTTGQTLTFGSGGAANAPFVLEIGDDAMISPVLFAGTGPNSYDTISVDGSVQMGEMAYIQPFLGANARQNPANTAQTLSLLTTTTAGGTISFANDAVGLARQQYAWADATVENFSSIMDWKDPNLFSAPVIYSIDYSDPTKITLEKELVWNGNFLGAIGYDGGNMPRNLVELGETMNYMLYHGADATSYYTDIPFLLNVASISAQPDGERRAALAMKQFTPEVYASRITLAALNGLQYGELVIDQMANVRQYLGIPSRKGIWCDGTYSDSEKRRHYDPFLSQLDGDDAIYTWATPVGQWYSRTTDGDLVQDYYGYRFEQYGVNLGAAKQYGSVTLGIAGGWQSGNFSARDTYQKIDVSSWQLTLLASRSVRNFFADAWFGYHGNTDRSRREVLAGGTLGDPEMLTVGSKYNIGGWTGGFTVGANMALGEMGTLTPLTGFRFGTARNSTIYEDAMDFVISRDAAGIYEVPLGARMMWHWKVGDGWQIAPLATAEYIFRFGRQSPDLYAEYFGNYIYTEGATIPGVAHGNLQLNAYRGGFQTGLEYDGALGNHFGQQRVGLTAGFIF